MRITERLPILIAAIITAISALFCIVGLATKGWGIYNTLSNSLFCDQCPKSSQALSIISFILLIASVISLLLQIFGILHGRLRFVPIIILFITTIFLLATFVAYVKSFLGYSYDLMVAAHFFSYIALALVAYWLGQLNNTSGSTG